MPIVSIYGLDSSIRRISTNPLHLVDAKGRRLNEGEIRNLFSDIAHDLCHAPASGNKNDYTFEKVVIEMENGKNLVILPKEYKQQYKPKTK